jgi:hypothetical protein
MNSQPHAAYVTAGLGYLLPQNQKPYTYMFQPPDGQPWTNCDYGLPECRIHDARRVPSAIGLETSGFELCDAPTAVGDFHDAQQVNDIYYREVEALAIELTGGMQAIVFDHALRQREPGRPSMTFGRHGDGTKPAAVGRVHNDYTETSAQRRMQMMQSDSSGDHPFLILNFWRPIGHPVFDTPLAMCDARSFPSRDWVESDLIYPARTGEIYLAKHSPAHRWYYYPRMTPDEVLVFKSYDSRRDLPVRMTPHCAFDDPTAAPDAPLRQSIEIRCLVMLE